MSSQTVSSKHKEEPAVVALGVVVHESTTKLTSATGVMVHLFGGDFELVMMKMTHKEVGVRRRYVCHKEMCI